MQIRNFLIVLYLSCLLLLTMSGSAHAYIDMGTGSYIIQILIGGFLGVMLALKLYWDRVKTFFSRLFSKKLKNNKQRLNDE